MNLILLAECVPRRRSPPPWVRELCDQRRESFQEALLFFHTATMRSEIDVCVRAVYDRWDSLVSILAGDLFYVLYSPVALGDDRP